MAFASYPSLTNKIVFITGGGGGIGATLVETHVPGAHAPDPPGSPNDADQQAVAIDRGVALRQTRHRGTPQQGADGAAWLERRHPYARRPGVHCSGSTPREFRFVQPLPRSGHTCESRRASRSPAGLARRRRSPAALAVLAMSARRPRGGDIVRVRCRSCPANRKGTATLAQ